ncbi:protein kinase, partial [Microbacterium thalli]
MAELRRRAHDSPAAPIELDDREVDRLLSTSPRADVHLYRDAGRRHPVVVKARRDAVGDGDRAEIEASLQRLVTLSVHPAIATVHGGGVAPDGRPYVVMEYCSRADLAESTERQVPTVADTLRLVIQLSGAVESAHRSGLVHGRVAIENVLTTDYGWPALIGFDADALTPRRVDPDAAARAVDVHGLAVAASELLTGRPIAEAESALPSEDAVPADLEALVLDVLERTRAGGGPTAAEFARALQGVEVALHLPLTHLDIRDPDGTLDAGDDHTVLSTRRDTATDDHTVLSTRRDTATDDHTVLSTRRDTATDDHTVLSTRRDT